MISFQPSPTSVTARPRTVVLLIRHGATDAMYTGLAGRRAGVALNALGQEQAGRVAAVLAALPLAAIYSSPLVRARATAAPLAATAGLSVRVHRELTEVDFGEWTGLTFDRLAVRPDWQTYNTSRSSADVPGGERPAAASARISRALATLHGRHPGETIAVFTHAELVRYAILRARGLPLDRWADIDVPPASITVLECCAWHVREFYRSESGVAPSREQLSDIS